MPSKGKYFINDNDDLNDSDLLYESYLCASHHCPLLQLLLFIGVASCLTLIVCFFASYPHYDPREHLAFIIAVFITLVIFCVLYVLVRTECSIQWRLTLYAVLVWVCLMTIGYVIIFDNGRVSPWDQVPFFLFIILTVYTMLPFGMREAIIISVLSAVSHILVVSIAATVFSSKPKDKLALQGPQTYGLQMFKAKLHEEGTEYTIVHASSVFLAAEHPFSATFLLRRTLLLFPSSLQYTTPPPSPLQCTPPPCSTLAAMATYHCPSNNARLAYPKSSTCRSMLDTCHQRAPHPIHLPVDARRSRTNVDAPAPASTAGHTVQDIHHVCAARHWQQTNIC